MAAGTERRDSPERRERRAAVRWLLCIVTMFLPVPVYLGVVFVWVVHLRPRLVQPGPGGPGRGGPGSVDTLSAVILIGGLAVTVAAIWTLKAMASNAYAKMREARADQVVRAHLADLRGDGAELAQMRDRARIAALVPIIGTAVGVLIVLYLVLS